MRTQRVSEKQNESSAAGQGLPGGSLRDVRPNARSVKIRRSRSRKIRSAAAPAEGKTAPVVKTPEKILHLKIDWEGVSIETGLQMLDEIRTEAEKGAITLRERRMNTPSLICVNEKCLRVMRDGSWFFREVVKDQGVEKINNYCSERCYQLVKFKTTAPLIRT